MDLALTILVFFLVFMIVETAIEMLVKAFRPTLKQRFIRIQRSKRRRERIKMFLKTILRGWKSYEKC